MPGNSKVVDYDSDRFSVLTGVVQSPAGAAIGISIAGRPDYGTVAPDPTTGEYSIAVEGGGLYVVQVRATNSSGTEIPTVDRLVEACDNQVCTVPLIQLVDQDSPSTFQLNGNPNTIITHTSTITNGSGEGLPDRSMRTVLTGDTKVFHTDGNGNDLEEITGQQLTIRSSEYPTPDSMPGDLPANSAFTFCAEMKLEGYEHVRFDKPVIFYVDEFLNFEVGEIVPSGAYNRNAREWEPSSNGFVIKLLDTDSDGTVDALDADGDGVKDDLDGDGDFADEIAGMTDKSAGSKYWRIEATHFSPWDFNWPFGVPVGAVVGWLQKFFENLLPENFCPTAREGGSYITDWEGVVHEDIPIPGTSLTLHYSSEWTPDYKRKFSVKVTGDTFPEAPLKRIHVELDIAGMEFKETIDAVDIVTNMTRQFVWDGNDHRGERVEHRTLAVISVGYSYDAVYMPGGIGVGDSFAQYPDIVDITPDFSRQEVVFWNRDHILVDVPPGEEDIAEGWMISGHLRSHPSSPATLFGDSGPIGGGGDGFTSIISGSGAWRGLVLGDPQEGVPATDVAMSNPTAIETDAEGNVYFLTSGVLKMIEADTGMLVILAGGSGTSRLAWDSDHWATFPPWPENGDPGVEAALMVTNSDLEIDSEGNLYFVSDYRAFGGGYAICKLAPNGILTLLAGGKSGTGYDPNDEGGPVSEAKLNGPHGLAVDDAGNLYIAEPANHIVRKIDTNGNITTIAGQPEQPTVSGNRGDGGFAADSHLDSPFDVEVDSDGNVYIAEGIYDYSGEAARIRKIDSTGIITTYAGGGSTSSPENGTLAVDAKFTTCQQISFDNEGNLYLCEVVPRTVWKIDVDGRIERFAGNGAPDYTFTNTIVGQEPAALMPITVISAHADSRGNVYIGTHPLAGNVLGPYILKVSKNGSSAVKDLGNDEIQVALPEGVGIVMGVFDGLEKRVVDLHTGVTLTSFGYDANEKLVSITDQFSNQISIQRDGTGKATSITSPDGIVTGLTVDTDNNLVVVTYPHPTDPGQTGPQYDFLYENPGVGQPADGLMTGKVEPEGNVYGHVFDENGRAIEMSNSEGGLWTFNRFIGAQGNPTVMTTTGEGDVTTYVMSYAPDGTLMFTVTDPSGNDTVYTGDPDDPVFTNESTCGTLTETTMGFDEEYGWEVTKSGTRTLPSGLTQTFERDRTYADNDSDEVPDLITDTVTINGKTYTVQHNTLTSTITLTSPEGRVATTTYDPATLLTLSTSAPGLHDVTYLYDAQGRIDTVTQDLRSAKVTYDPATGGVATITANNDPATMVSYDYDRISRLAGVTDPDAFLTAFDFDDNGNLETLTTPTVKDHVFTSDLANRPETYTSPLNNVPPEKRDIFTYDDDGALDLYTSAAGLVTDLVYANGLLDRIDTPEAESVQFTYENGKVKTATKTGPLPTESTTYGYDGERVISSTMAGTLNQTISNTYNNDYAVDSVTYAGATDSLTYDDDGLLASAGVFTIDRDDPLNPGQSNDSGRVEFITDGTLTVTPFVTLYGEMDGVDYDVGGSSVAGWDLLFNDLGRIADKSETVGATTVDYVYTYDDLGRLLTVKKDTVLVESYTYDANGNRLSDLGRSYTYDDDDRLIGAGSVTYAFDDDGYLTTKTDGADVTTYDYASSGQLLSVFLPDTTLIEYIHDAGGQRVAKKVNGTVTEVYLWGSLTQLLAVYDGNGALVTRFEYAAGRMPLAMETGGATYYLAYDQVGSLRAIVDTSGTVVREITYDSFGNILSETGSGPSTPFGFAGGLHDRDTGLVRFGFRDYDPEVGRWTAKDPIGFAGGDTNQYAYVGSNPISLIDPSGLLWNPIVAIYTGDGNAPPSVYNAAVEAAGNYIYDRSAFRGASFGVGVDLPVQIGTKGNPGLSGGGAFSVDEGFGAFGSVDLSRGPLTVSPASAQISEGSQGLQYGPSLGSSLDFGPLSLSMGVSDGSIGDFNIGFNLPSNGNVQVTTGIILDPGRFRNTLCDILDLILGNPFAEY